MRLSLTTLIATALVSLATAAERVALLGDSITYDGRWATRVESALRATPRFADAEIVNFGLPSETVSGLSETGHAGGKFPRPCLHERLERILSAFRPTLVLSCYGINDGIYQPSDSARTAAFQNGMTKLQAALKSCGARWIAITPPLFRADQADPDPARYDAVLDAYADWLVNRRTQGCEVIDIRADLRNAIADEKRSDPKFVFAADNVHPGDRGHAMIATSICGQLWPMLKLSGPPAVAHDGALKILHSRQNLLKHAWLTKTGHQRPGIPAGLPLDQAAAQAKTLLDSYREALPKDTPDQSAPPPVLK